MRTTRILQLITLSALLIGSSSYAMAPVQSPRLYAIDCGRIDFKDMSVFSDTGEYDGKPGFIVDPCFLIVHPKGTLLWDVGLGDKLVGRDGPPNAMGISMHVASRLLDQLALIEIRPDDITWLAFSHLHLDHTGNANAFAAATWIMNSLELEWAQSTQLPAVDLESFSAYKSAKTQMINADFDVFGDGTVRILKAPGHTPGHQVLLLRLSKSGVVILSGDLYHMRSDRPQSTGSSGRVMTINSDRAESLASISRIETILKNTRGRLIIQHDPDDFRSLPKFPSYLD